MVPQLGATTLVTLKMTKVVDLPLEILLEILSYNTIAQNRLPTPVHPLNALASTNKHLYSVVEEYTRGLLKRCTNFTPPKSSKTFSCRKKWLAETCQFCKRKSQRRAILYAGLTVCRLCDKQYFPKMVHIPLATCTSYCCIRAHILQTMTQASKTHFLSKFDLFTPNVLHPLLPLLTTGLYTVMGSAATMILERDVLARKAHIRALLGPCVDGEDMHKRPAAHDRIAAHLGLYYCPSRGGWRQAPTMSPAALEKAAKSMQSLEGREEYARKALVKEWEAMGQDVESRGIRDNPVELED
jgi:hypothetical protein